MGHSQRNPSASVLTLASDGAARAEAPAMAQTAGAICIRSLNTEKPSLVYFMTIDNAKFRKPVVPGDQLRIHVKKIKKRGNLLKFACEAMVDGAKAAEAEVSAMMVTG